MNKKIKTFILIYTLLSVTLMSNIRAQINTETININVKNNETKKIFKSTIENYYIVYKENGAIRKSNRYAEIYGENRILKSYSKNGNLLEIIRLKNNDTIKRVSYLFDKDNLIEKKVLGIDNLMITTVRYIYNTDDKLYIKEKFSNQGKISTDTLKYDQEGRLKFKSTGNAKGKLLFSFLYDLDSNENLVEYSYFNYLTDDFTRITYKYNSFGNIIEKINEINDNLSEKIAFKYDSKGNVTEEKKHDYDGSLVYKKTFDYKFDKDNNWIRKIIYKEGIPLYLIERKIQYY